ncbi:Crp/Fnr family transcriptional regulator [Sphingomonas sp. 22L2VL55-3]
MRDQALCSSLSDVELGALNTLGRRRKIARGQTLIWAGDESIICANLLSGVLKLVAATPDGREQIVGLLYPADFVGQPYAGQADFTITALTDLELCIFPRDAFERVLEDHSRMKRLLLQRTLAALGVARTRILSLARQSAQEKIAGFLLDMAVRATATGCRATPDGPMTFDLPLTRGQIADVLGLTIETVSRQMTSAQNRRRDRPAWRPRGHDLRSGCAARARRGRLNRVPLAKPTHEHVARTLREPSCAKCQDRELGEVHRLPGPVEETPQHIAERFRARRRKAGQGGKYVVSLDRIADTARAHAPYQCSRERIAYGPREQRIDHRSLIARVTDHNGAQVAADRVGVGTGQSTGQRIGACLQPVAHAPKPGMSGQ